MPGQKLTTVNDDRCSFDQQTGAVRSFFGAELVERPQDIDSFEAFVPAEVEAEALNFLELNQHDFKLANIELKQSVVREGAAAKAVTFQQYHHGVPVYKAELTVGFRAKDGHVLSAVNGIDYSLPDAMRPDAVSLSGKDAADIVRTLLSNEVRKVNVGEPHFFLYRHSSEPYDPPREDVGKFRNEMLQRGTGVAGDLYWVWQLMVDTEAPDGSWEMLVDATDRSIVKVADLRRYATHRACVFKPDPITSSQNADLTWEIETHILDEQRQIVMLEDLDPPDETGACVLSGPWAKCVDRESPSHSPPSSTGDFMYGSKERDFLFTMAYYWTDQLIRYLRGFDIKELNEALVPIELDAVGREQQFSTGGFKQVENSFFSDKDGKPSIAFGDGGVPDSSDAHVIVHECGHAIHYFLKCRHYCYEEGFCDFLAAVWLDRFNEHGFDREAVFPWDNNKAINWGPERRLDLHYQLHDPDFANLGTYEAGIAWATALWKLFESIGGGKDEPLKTRMAAADAVIHMYLEMLLLVTDSSADKKERALGLIAVDQALHGNEGKYRQQICDAFAARGLVIGSADPSPPVPIPL